MEGLVYEINLAAARAGPAGGGRGGRQRQPSDLGGGRPRADDAHGLDVAGRQRSRRPAGHLRRPRGRLSRAGARAPRRRSRPAPPGDGLRHAQSQGGPLRDREALRRDAAAACPILASITFVQVGSDRMMTGQTVEACWNSISHAPLLGVGINCSLGPRDMRPHLDELQRIAPTFVSCYPNAGLPNPLLPTGFPETPEDMAPVLGDWARNGLAEHRGRLLRDDARSHPGHRGGGARRAAARAPEGGAVPPALRLGLAHPPSGHELRERRRAHQRHRLAAVLQAHPGRRLRAGGGGRAPAGDERRPDPRHQHGRGDARLRGGHDPLRQPHRRGAGHRARAHHGRQLEVDRDRGRPQVSSGQGNRRTPSRSRRARRRSRSTPASSAATAQRWW